MLILHKTDGNFCRFFVFSVGNSSNLVYNICYLGQVPFDFDALFYRGVGNT